MLWSHSPTNSFDIWQAIRIFNFSFPVCIYMYHLLSVHSMNCFFRVSKSPNAAGTLSMNQHCFLAGRNSFVDAMFAFFVVCCVLSLAASSTYSHFIELMYMLRVQWTRILLFIVYTYTHTHTDTYTQTHTYIANGCRLVAGIHWIDFNHWRGYNKELFVFTLFWQLQHGPLLPHLFLGNTTFVVWHYLWSWH